MGLTVGEKIALLRSKKGITQTELAEYLFLAPQTVSRWEVGNGAPEITLLPKIATFFGVSIDELFGVTAIQRTQDLVAKYSVLRDDHTFREAMESIDSQQQTIDALLKSGTEDAALERDRDQLKAEKIHMWIQQGREAFQRAFELVDAMVTETEGKPDHPWYLPMRLQRDQLCIDLGRGRETLAARRQELAQQPSHTALLRYLCMLSDLQDYETILSILKTAGPLEDIIFPPSQENLSVWRQFIHAAAEMGQIDLIERHMPAVLAVCSEAEEFDLLMCLLRVYQGEQLAAIKGRLRTLLPKASCNKYFEETIRQRIEQ